MIKKMHHGAITISDMDRSLVFYRDMLDMKVTMDFEVHGPEWDALMQESNVRFRIVYFEE